MLIISCTVTMVPLCAADKDWVEFSPHEENNLNKGWVGVFSEPDEEVQIALANTSQLAEQDADNIYSALKMAGIGTLDSTRDLMEILERHKKSGRVNSAVLKHELIAKTYELRKKEERERPLSDTGRRGWIMIKPPEKADASTKSWWTFGW